MVERVERGAAAGRSRLRFGVSPRVLFTLIFVAFALIGALTFLQLRSERNAEDQLTLRFTERAEFAAGFVETALADATLQMRGGAGRLLSSPGTGAAELASFMAAWAPGGDHGVLADANGEVIATFPSTNRARGDPGSPAIRAALEQGSFVGGVVETSDGDVLDLAVRFQTPSGPRVISDSLPVRAVQGLFQQFLAGVADLEGGGGYVVDRSGTVIGSSEAGSPATRPADAGIADLLGSAEASGTFERGDEVTAFAAERVPRSDLRVVLTEPEDHLLGPADEAAKLGWILVGVIGLTGFGSVGLLIGHLNRQRRLATAHERLRDQLTGLPNRAQLTAELAGLLEASGEQRRAALITLDLDRFGRVNDSLGAGTGDSVLLEVANRLSSCAGDDCLVSRLGGDEFALLAAGVNDLDGADVCIERVRAGLERPIEIEGHQFVMTAKFGVTIIGAGEKRAEMLIAASGEALARAKASSRVVCYSVPDDRERTMRRLMLESDLRSALLERELDVHYQLVVSMPEREPLAVEALVRWQHPTLGAISPSEFIPLAEESDLVGAVGKFVLAEAAQQAVRWREGGRDVVLQVNLSAKQLADPDLCRQVSEELSRSGLAPDRLCLEITETALLEEPTLAKRHLEELSSLGVRIALDDFGVGFSSLSHIADLAPIEQVKIDSSFVSNLDREREAAIVTSLAALCNDLGLEVVAEGIETTEQADHLVRRGVHIGQGYLFARPLPAEAITALLGPAESTVKVPERPGTERFVKKR